MKELSIDILLTKIGYSLVQKLLGQIRSIQNIFWSVKFGTPPFYCAGLKSVKNFQFLGQKNRTTKKRDKREQTAAVCTQPTPQPTPQPPRNRQIRILWREEKTEPYHGLLNIISGPTLEPNKIRAREPTGVPKMERFRASLGLWRE